MLYNNYEGLSRAFSAAKKMDPKSPDGKAGLTIKCARNFFMTFVDREVFTVDVSDVDRMFVYSMMTITDEEDKVKLRKYS